MSVNDIFFEGPCSLNSIFYQLVRVSLGSQETLSRPPSEAEWETLYSMSKKQSLIGICFVGVQKLYNNDNPEPITPNSHLYIIPNQEPITKNLDEVQYFTWMGTAA